MLPGDLFGQKVATLVIASEDSWETQITPRLIAAGADLDLISSVEVEWVKVEDGDTVEMRPVFPIHMPAIHAAFEASGAKLLIIDPAPTMIAPGLNPDKVEGVRRAYEPLMKSLEKYGAAALLQNHFKKGATNSNDALSGSHAWRDIVRSYLSFASVEGTNKKVFTQEKNNYGTSLESYEYEVVPVDVELDDGTIGSYPSVGEIVASETSVDEINYQPQRTDEEVLEQDEKKLFIYQYIRDNGWSCPAKDVIEFGRDHDLNDLAVVRNRMKRPPVHSEKEKKMKGQYIWSIPDEQDRKMVLALLSARTMTYEDSATDPDSFDTDGGEV
jgi:hypothetical protein